MKLEKGNTIEEEVAKLLVKHNLTIAVAESCTGGLVSSTLINYPGISSVFMEGRHQMPCGLTTTYKKRRGHYVLFHAGHISVIA